MRYEIEPIGTIRSELKQLADAPRQGDEGGYAAWLHIKPEYTEGLVGLSVGDNILVLTWLHEARRDVLQVHPRGDHQRPLTGVFATRSPHRPNPIGLHPVTVLQIDANRVQVAPIEAIDGTPIADIKTIITDIHNR